MDTNTFTVEEDQYRLFADSVTNDLCGLFIWLGDEIFFSLPHDTGTYELSFDLSSTNNHTITFYKGSSSLNTIGTQGAIQIDSIRTDSVFGKIDARADGNYFINGNFRLPVCD